MTTLVNMFPVETVKDSEKVVLIQYFAKECGAWITYDVTTLDQKKIIESTKNVIAAKGYQARVWVKPS